MTGQEIAGNVVRLAAVDRPARYRHQRPATDWIRSAARRSTPSAPTWSTPNNRSTSPTVPETAPGHLRCPTRTRHDVHWTGTSTSTRRVPGPGGDLGRSTPAADLRTGGRPTRASAGTSPSARATWRWADELGHPVPATAGPRRPRRDLLRPERRARTAPTSVGVHRRPPPPSRWRPRPRAQARSPAGPARGLTGADLEVTVPAGSSGDREYVAKLGGDLPRSSRRPRRVAPGGTRPAWSMALVESDDISLETPTRPGHAFAGWTGTGLAEPTATAHDRRRLDR